MNLISIAVISHERPLMLKKMLDSLDSISKKDMFDIYVCDNSVLNKDLIKEICNNYSSIGYYPDAGCSQRQNYIKSL